MTTEKKLDEILAEIGREYRAIGAPEKLESGVRTAADNRRSALNTPALRVKWAWAVAMILLAAVVTTGVMWQTRRSHQPQNQEVRSVPAPQVRPEPTIPSEPGTVRRGLKSKPAPVRRSARGRAAFGDSSTRPATWNSMEEFVPLPVSEGLPLAAELSVVRVKLKGGDLQQYGLEAPADAVTQAMLAEFVVGEDGLPRAIRIVR